MITPPENNKPAEPPRESTPPPISGEQMNLPLNNKPDEPPFAEPDPAIPKALRDLMVNNQVDEWEIQNAVAARGYFPSDMPIRDYPGDFISGVLVGAWGQVFGMIQQARETMEIPFN